MDVASIACLRHASKLQPAMWRGNKLAARSLIRKRSKPRSASVLRPSVQPQCDVFTSKKTIRGEVLLITPSCETKSDAHVILIPGNPGIIEYYRPLLQKLQARLPHDIRKYTSFHAVGLPGHDMLQLNGERTFVIDDHVEYFDDYIREMTKGGDDVIFVGHSYGSFLALRLMEKFERDSRQMARMVMLMPCIWQMKRCCGNVLGLMLKDRWGMFSWCAWLATALIPPLVRDKILARSELAEGVIPVSRNLFDGQKRSLFSNVTSLARDEMRNIKELKHSTAFLDALVAWVDDDQWCPAEARKHIDETFRGSVKMEEIRDTNHAFVTNERQTNLVVRVVAPWISSRIRTSRNQTNEEKS